MMKKFSFLSLNLCPNFFGPIKKRLAKNARVNFKMYDVTNCETNNYNINIAQFSKSKGNQTMKLGQLIE